MRITTLNNVKIGFDALPSRLIEAAKCQMFYRELDEIQRKGDHIKIDDMDAL